MNLLWLLVVILILAAVFGHSRWQPSYGYYPTGGIGIVVIILVVLLLAGRL
jgi:hypothetical protein